MSIRNFARNCFAFVFVVAAIGCAPAASEQAAAPSPTPAETPDPRPKIIAFGDSLTSGFGIPERERSYPALLQKRLDAEGYSYKVLNHGQGGDTSQQGLDRLYLATGIGSAEILIVEFGANDAAQNVPVETVRANLDQILTRIAATNKRVLLCGIRPPEGKDVAYSNGFAAMFRELAQVHNVELLEDFMKDVAGEPSHLLADGIHPNESGTRIIADRVFDSLWPLLKKNESKH